MIWRMKISNFSTLVIQLIRDQDVNCNQADDFDRFEPLCVIRKQGDLILDVDIDCFVNDVLVKHVDHDKQEDDEIMINKKMMITMTVLSQPVSSWL